LVSRRVLVDAGALDEVERGALTLPATELDAGSGARRAISRPDEFVGAAFCSKA
jgi:hypothetical protein